MPNRKAPLLRSAMSLEKASTGTFPPARAVFEPGFVVHRRLHFEEKNTERYGWDLGFVTPFVSTAYFYKDVLLWPNSLASGVVTGFWDTNAGKCLPGSPVPYCFYPPGLTITGTNTPLTFGGVGDILVSDAISFGTGTLTKLQKP